VYFAVHGRNGDGAYEVYLYDASAYATGEILLWLIIAAMLLIAIIFVAFFIYKVHQFNQFRCVSSSITCARLAPAHLAMRARLPFRRGRPIAQACVAGAGRGV